MVKPTTRAGSLASQRRQPPLQPESNVEYFSEREEGARPRDQEDIGEVPWGGIASLIRRYLAKDSFTATTNKSEFWRALRAEIPGISGDGDLVKLPPTLVVLDVIEFCWRFIEKPIHTEDPPFPDFRLFPPPGLVSCHRGFDSLA